MQDAVDTVTVDPSGPLESQDSAEDVQPTGAPVFTRGACLGRYVVLEAIGSGGMGTIFKAYDPELDRIQKPPFVDLREIRRIEHGAKLSEPR